MVTIANRGLRGYEALARFADGRSPLEHLADAARDGTLVDLEIDLIKSAIEGCRLLDPELTVSLNASAKTIMDPRLSDLFVPGGRPWGIELSEFSPEDDTTCIREQVSALGAALLVDDAGTGHSGEDRILHLRPEIVKIDKQVFWNAATDKGARTACESLIEAAFNADSRILVEGIETEQHADFAQLLGAELAQGYLYGAAGALPSEQLLGERTDRSRGFEPG